MEFNVDTTALDALATPLLVVPTFSDDGARGEAYDEANALVGGRLSGIVEEEGYKAEAGKTLLVHTSDAKARRVLLVGVGKAEDYEPLALRSVASSGVQEANGRKLDSATLLVPEAGDRARAMGFAAQGALLGGYRYDHWRTQNVEPLTCQRLGLATGGVDVDGAEAAVAQGEAIGEAVNFARDLMNGPAVEITPTAMAEAARDIARDGGLEVKIFDEAEITRRGMNLILSVSAGSDEEARFIHLTYRPEGATDDTPEVALVGKGVTFDSGGYSLKPSAGMEDMKMDMGGGAAVLGAMKAIAAVKPKYVVHGIVPASENLINGKATKVGDIVRSLNGKTVEIMNTDAEGRLLLADALCYAERLGVDRVIDLATLTGASVVALGPHTAALFAGDEAFGDKIKEASERAGEDFWPMPLNKKLREMLETPNADMKNVGQRWGGAITAGLFLEEFVGDMTWCHLDIAGPAMSDKADGYVPKGGTGFGVMTLVELLQGEV
ncbi:MAG: leucyl aminopeptidase [Myxococcota bacterium]